MNTYTFWKTSCLCAFTVLALAISAIASQSGDFTYTDNGTTITITKYTGTGAAVTIPSAIASKPVTIIGTGAFSSYSKLTSITIPSSVTGIGNNAFFFCTGLTSVTLPSNLTIIGNNAFLSCTKLTNITIPNSVTSIGSRAFSGCSKLTGVTIGNGVTSIGDSAFASCNAMTAIAVHVNNSVYSGEDGVLFNKDKTTLIQCPEGKAGSYTIPNTVTSIEAGAFNSCAKLTGVIIGTGTTSIGDNTFKSCSGLTSVTIPGNITSIGQKAFLSCSGLTSVTIPNSVTSIGQEAFSTCSKLTGVIIGTGVTSIGDNVFSSCSVLTDITVNALNPAYSSDAGVLFNKDKTTLIQCPEGKAGSYTIPGTVTSIGTGAFIGCSKLTDITIPDTVTGIGAAAFQSCTHLTKVTFPSSVTSIGNNAFLNCTGLAYAIFFGNAPIMGSTVFDSCSPYFTVYYLEETSGFTSPLWNGYPSAVLVRSTLIVNSSGVLSVPISSTTGHGGETNYTIKEFNNTNVSLTAPDIFGMNFTGWTTGNVSSSLKTINFIMTGDIAVTANFVKKIYTVLFSAGTNGTITGNKSQTVNHGDSCTQVTPTPLANYHFTGWTGDYTGDDNPLTLTNVSSSKAITANFARNTAVLTVNRIGNGTAGFSVVNPVNTVTAIPIMANAYPNNHFTGWTIDSGSATIANAKSAATTVTLTGGHGSMVTLIANFAQDTNIPTSLPKAPVVSATDGIYEDRVVVTWKAVATATSYEVYRNTTKLTPAESDKLGDTTDCIFEDNTAEYGTTYFYFARARNSMGASVKFSTGDSGYVAKAPAVPGAVTASDGTYFDKIRVSWTKVSGATSYLVFRTEAQTPAPNPDLVDPIGETGALFLDDLGDDLVPQVGGVVKKYYYWIAAKNANATTVLSKPNDGYLSKKGPAKLTASNGTYSNRIAVTWTEVPGATDYDVYRYSDANFTQIDNTFGTAGIVKVAAALDYEDYAVTANILYYYKVKAKYGTKYDSDISPVGAIGKSPGGPPTPAATALANGVTSENIVDMPIGSYLYFSIDVPMGTTRMIATLAGPRPPVGKTNDCDMFAKFANLPTLTSYNAKGVENNTTEILTVSNPAAGRWYFMLYGTTAYSDVQLTVDFYAVADIVLTQIPINDLSVPFTAAFKGTVVDDSGAAIPNIVLQVRNPITGLTSSLAKTDAKGLFSYSAPINTEGEHTFDFFFTDIPDTAKGTASHTVATRKGCILDAPDNYFDVSAYHPATPVAVPLHADVIGLQNFLDTRNGWDDNPINSTYETMWINSTLVKAGNDTQLAAQLDQGLYMFFYGVEGAGVGNDTATTPALSTVPFVAHVESNEKKAGVLAALNNIGVIGGPQKAAIETGSIGIVAVAALSVPDEGLTPKSISLLACEQLEILVILAGWSQGDTGVTEVQYSGVTAKKITVTLSSGRKINVIASAFTN